MKYIFLITIVALLASCAENKKEPQEKNSHSIYSASLFQKSSIINIDSSEYSFRNERLFPDKRMGFGKAKDSNSFSVLFIHDYYYDNRKDSVYNLEDLLTHFSKVWGVVDQENGINLRSASVGYPLEYPDVLKNQIEAFINSKDWQPYIHESELNLDYKLIKEVMIESDVYKPLNNFLKTKGYKISGLQLEKHGHVTSDKLEELGYDRNLMIPVPFMVWVEVSRL